MNIYLIRHGQSEGNAQKISQADDTPLSTLGHEQAQSVAQRIKNITIDSIVCSPLTRAQHTAQHVLETVGKPLEVHYHPLFREQKRPSEIIGKHYQEEQTLEIKRQIIQNSKDKDWRYSDEENFHDLKQRCQKASKYLVDHQDSNILVVSHGSFIATFVYTAIFDQLMTPEINEKLRRSHYLNNTSLTWMTYENETWQLITWNDHAHLG